MAALAEAKARWADAPIDDYQIDVAESGNYWMSGCKWTTIVTGGVVVKASVDPSSTSEYCGEVEWTVSNAHEHVARFAGFADGAGPGRLGENKLEVAYNEFGVPATIEFDLANSADEESFLRLRFTSLE